MTPTRTLSLCSAALLLTLTSRASAQGAPPPSTAPAAAASAPAPAPGGEDFIEDARLLYRVVACTGDSPLPANLDSKAVEAYCARQRTAMDRYRKTYVQVAEPFIAKLRPAGLPTTVVYPFGGGDLLSALTTYPEARDITTMSLEHAGDPRRLRTVKTKEQVETSLELIRSTSTGLLLMNDSLTASLMKGQQGEIPGQIAFFLIALAVHGYEPISLHYFRIEPDGSLAYLSQADVAAIENKKANLLHAGWVSPDFSEAFSNSELVFAPKGSTNPSTFRVHRHLAADLMNQKVSQRPGLMKFLEAKGQIAAMTKAASYLLWREDFATVRDYLLHHMVFMISDSTGIPPRYAQKAGFVQETYGHFEESFLRANPGHNDDFKKLWEATPERKLDFRYGYIDHSKHYHMLITKKAVAAKGE